MFRKNLPIDEQIDRAIASYLVMVNSSYKQQTHVIRDLRKELDLTEDVYEATEENIFQLMDETNDIILSNNPSKGRKLSFTIF